MQLFGKRRPTLPSCKREPLTLDFFPQQFDAVEFRRVGGQKIQQEPAALPFSGAVHERLRSVPGGIVQHHDGEARQVSREDLEGLDDVFAAQVLLLLKIQKMALPAPEPGDIDAFLAGFGNRENPAPLLLGVGGPGVREKPDSSK